MNAYLIALSPLLVALTALVFVLPIGLFFANREREHREARAAFQALSALDVIRTIPLIVPQNATYAIYGHEAPLWGAVAEVAQRPEEPISVKMRVTSALGDRQPLGKLPEAA